VVNEVIIPRLQQEPFSPVAGGLLKEIVADDAHHGLVDLVLEEGHRWLVHNQETFTEVVGERAPWWAPQRLNTAVTERLHLEAIRGWPTSGPTRTTCAHRAGQHAGSARRRPAVRRGDPGACGAAEEPAARAPPAGHRRHGDLERPAGRTPRGARRHRRPLRSRAEHELVDFGERLGRDDALRARLDGWASDLAVFVVERYGSS
jgi:hypothetical protein